MRLRPVVVFVFACVLAAVAPAHAQNAPDAPENAAPAAETRAKSEEELLARRLFENRLNGAAASMQFGLSNYALDSLLVRYGAALEPLATPEEKAQPFLWNIFFSGAGRYLGCLESERPVVGYYNPVLDSWVLTAWSRQTVMPAQASLVPGSFFRGSAEHGPELPWVASPDAAKAFASALKYLGDASAAGFARAFPADCAQPLPIATGDEGFSRTVSGRLNTAFFSVAALKKEFTDDISSKSIKGATLAHYAIIQMFNYGNVKPYQKLSGLRVEDQGILDLASLDPELRVVPLTVITNANGSGRDLIVHSLIKKSGTYMVSEIPTGGDENAKMQAASVYFSGK